MRSVLTLAPALVAAALLSGCVIVDGPVVAHPVAPAGVYVPPGVAYVAPGGALPAPGYVWRYHPRYGWGWWHPRFGWYAGWR